MPSVIHKSAEGTEIVPNINDGTVDWNNIHSLYIYTDGYYGRSLEEPMIIEDANTIEDIVWNVLKEEQYHKVPFELYYEGTNAFFIQFDNDVWINMYKDEDYGCVSDHLDYTGSNCYYLPRGLRTKIIKLLKRNIAK